MLSTCGAIRPHSSGGNYINLQTADEDETRIAEAYGGNFDRLRRIKAADDPDNLFEPTATFRLPHEARLSSRHSPTTDWLVPRRGGRADDVPRHYPAWGQRGGAPLSIRRSHAEGSS